MFKVFISIFFSFIFTQNLSLSLISKFGDGGKVNELSELNTVTDFQYMENLLDVNYLFKENLHFYSQLEYTSPPLIGPYNNLFNQILNKYYIEYTKDRYRVKIGDLTYLSGYGMAINTSQDHTLDFDNMIRGVEAQYYINDDISIRTMMGSDRYSFRSVASLDSSDFFYDKRIKHFEIQYDLFVGNDLFSINNMSYTFLSDKSTHYKNQIINSTRSYISFYPNLIIKNDFSDRLDFGSIKDDEVNDNTHSLFTSGSLLKSDIYIEKTWIEYYKLLDDSPLNGSRFYFSIYRNFFGYDVTFDHLQYDAIYQMSNLINPPICMYESNSPLTSRTTTTIDFNNAIANQIEIRKMFGDIEWMFNASLFYKKVPHDDEGHITDNTISFSDAMIYNINNMEDYNKLKDFHPVQKMFTEASTWLLDYSFFLKIGFASYRNLGSETSVENVYTFPVHYSYKINNGSTITGYLEYQNKEKERNLFKDNGYYSQIYNTYYNSISYSFMYNYVISLFYEVEDYRYSDLEEIEEGTKKWYGMQLSLRLLDNNSIEVFYGSQRGGLVCANGVCGVYPGFKDGFKVTLRLNYDR